MSGFEAWLVASFAVWRVTHLLHDEDGPWDLARRWRERLGDGATGRMISCFYCLSVWVALPFVPWIATTWASAIVVWAALSGAAIVIERVSGRASTPPVEAARWHEEPPP